MKEINLTKGQVAIVDDEDFDYLNKWKWFAQKSGNTFYAARTIRKDGKKIQIYMHRIILNPTNGLEIDHINRNGLDNTRCNLRAVTHRENMWNSRTRRKYLGVHHDCNKYFATININGKNIHLGGYYTPEEAEKAYLEKAYHIIKSKSLYKKQP